MGFVQVLSPTDWIIRITIGIIDLIITGTLLRAEIIKRKSENPEFQSQYLRYSSLSSLWFGVICSLLLISSVVPGFCMMQVIGSCTIYLFQFLSLGLYQLSRLHYSFSKQQLHQKQGYPLWVFKVMIAVAIMNAIGALVTYWMVLTPVAKCGYRENGTFFYEYRERAILIDGDYYTEPDAAATFYTFFSTMAAAHNLWDLTTLMLYLWKIWKIGIIHKSRMHGVWDKVLFILQRIVILTVFYQFCHFTTTILIPLLHYLALSPDVESAVAIHRTATVVMVTSAVDSLAIFMMMNHNTSTYTHFLRVLRVLRLKYCCFCCWHRMVDRQLEILGLEENDKETSTGDTKSKESEPSRNDTVFSNLSKDVVYGSGLDLCSLDTARELNLSARTNAIGQNPGNMHRVPSDSVH